MTIYNELSYDMEYSGKNIEDGIKIFIEKHPLIISTSKNTDGIPERYTDDVSKIKSYFNQFDKANFTIAYLIVGWKILYEYRYSKSQVAEILGRNIDAKLDFQINTLMTDIKFRAGILLIGYSQERQLLSLFDERTYKRLGLQ